MTDPVETGEPEAQTLPLDAWHRARGARMVPFAGYHMPIQYTGEHGGIVAEHDWTRSSASLFDVSHMGQLIVSGDGAAQALEAVLPGDISGLAPGRIRYSLLLDDDGGILDDLMVTNITGDDGRRPTMSSSTARASGTTSPILREHLPDEITLTHLDEHALLALQGPEAAAVLDNLLPGAADELVFMRGTSVDWNGTTIGIGRSGYTGEDGFELSVPAEHAETLATALTADDRVTARRTGRARQSAAGGGAAAVRPRSRHRYRSGQRRPAVRADQEASRDRRLERPCAGQQGSGRRCEDQARRLETRWPDARARRGRRVSWRCESGPRHQRRFLAYAGSSRGDGLCRRGVRHARHRAGNRSPQQTPDRNRGADAVRAAPLFSREVTNGPTVYRRT